MAHLSVLSPSARKREFGTFSWSPKGDSEIVIDKQWVKQNIGRVFVKQLRGIATYGGPFNGWVTCHNRVADQLQQAWQAVENRGLLSLVRFWDGSYVPRRIRGSTSLSPHSWGIAFDINAKWNPYRMKPAVAGAVGSVVPLVPIFEQFGFAWGGYFKKTPDPMHFECCDPGAFPAVVVSPIKVVLLIGRGEDEVIDCDARLEGNVVRVDKHKLAMALGVTPPVNGDDRVPIRTVCEPMYEVVAHLENGKVYVIPKQ